MRNWMMTVVVVALAGLLAPQTALGQEDQLTSLGEYGDWSVLNYDDRFNDNDAVAAATSAATGDGMLMVVCYATGQRKVVVIVDEYLYESSLEELRWIVDEGPVKRSAIGRSDSDMNGTAASVYRDGDYGRYDELVEDFRTGSEIYFRLEDEDEYEDVGFSLIGFTRAYEAACN